MLIGLGRFGGLGVARPESSQPREAQHTVAFGMPSIPHLGRQRGQALPVAALASPEGRQRGASCLGVASVQAMLVQ